MRKSMTLIELLVVIGAIAIIIGITYSTILQTRYRAYVVTCVNNIRQLVMAVHMYERDWDGVPIEGIWRLPDPKPYGDWKILPALLYPYLRSKEVFICPADPEKGMGDWKSIINGEIFPRSYAYTVNVETVKEFGKGDPRLKSRSILFICRWHEGIRILGRYDGSVEVAPKERYQLMRAEFASEGGD